ncbi:hypothetical protein [Baekduia alba]|uniref:hypothetical protein n=1 Tax=Baekduia alba TaxID=2997333 RepID=UPI00234026C1|nr:hypothetical protein [Baekduia alba]
MSREHGEVPTVGPDPVTARIAKIEAGLGDLAERIVAPTGPLHRDVLERIGKGLDCADTAAEMRCYLDRLETRWRRSHHDTAARTGFTCPAVYRRSRSAPAARGP